MGHILHKKIHDNNRTSKLTIRLHNVLHDALCFQCLEQRGFIPNRMVRRIPNIANTCGLNYRTRQVPFWKSKPSKYLAFMLSFVIAFAMIVPYTPLGAFFGFVPPPPTFYLALAGILGAYALLAETVKRWFYKRNANLVEQVLVPKRKTVYSVGKSARLMQDVIAVISLRSEDNISIDSLTEDVKSVSPQPINPERIVKDLQYLRRSGFVSIDWQRRTLTRKKTLKTYVKNEVMNSQTWPTIAEKWRRINRILQKKYNIVNVEYQEQLLQR